MKAAGQLGTIRRTVEVLGRRRSFVLYDIAEASAPPPDPEPRPEGGQDSGEDEVELLRP